jgi:DNA-binding NarL/FixJ family response regulator
VGARRTVLIVDDHVAFRQAARSLLEAEGYLVVGEAADAESALGLVQVLRPRIVLLDIQLPGVDGFEVARLLATQAEPPDVVLVSSRDATSYGSRLRDLPVRGFVTKSALSGETLDGLVG